MSFFVRAKPAKDAIPKLALFVPVLIVSLSPLGVARITSITSAANEQLRGGYVVIVIFLVFGFSLMVRDMLVGLRGGLDVRRRNSVRLMLYGTVATFVFAIATNLLLPIIVTSWAVSRLGPIFSLFLVGTISYGMVKHRLFDIRFFVVRATAYFTTLFVVAFLLVAPVVLAFGHFLDFHPHLSEFIVVLLLSVFALYLVEYIRQLFDRLTAKVFFRRYYDLQDVLDKLSDVLVRTADIDVLCDETAAVLRDALKPNTLRYALFARDGQDAGIAEKLSTYNAAATANIIDVEESGDKHIVALLKDKSITLAVKLRTTHEDLGYMLIGHRQSGEEYSDRDRRLLSVAADEIAISMQNALRFEEIQNFNATLQHNVDTATRKLRQTNTRLKQLNEAKDEFVSMASHQLRTPLTSVEGYLSMVLDGDAGALNEQQRKLLEQSYNSSRQMVYLISDLLNISRINTGKFVIEPAVVDLDQIVEGEVGQLTEIAKGRDITLNYDKPVNFPKLILDETKIHQVVMNLIDNAIHYTQQGGSVTVTLRETPTAVEYTVKDTGIGVPKAARFHLFTKFYRAPNAQKTRPDGTGLGLFMTKKVVTAQGGVIIFHSEEGKGSTFGFRLPKAGHLVTET